MIRTESEPPPAVARGPVARRPIASHVRARTATLAFLGAWSAGALASAQTSAPAHEATTGRAAPAATVFEGTTVVDVRTGRLSPDQTIVVAGNRIQAVGPAGAVRAPAGARVVKAHGTYAIPGLWDMHVHVNGFPNTAYPLFIANGVTGVREMSTLSLDSTLRWRREIGAGARVGPRTLTPGPLIVAPPESASWAVTVATPEEGRRVVDSLKRAGADFLKVHDGHSREVFFAIAAEARRLGMRLEGHPLRAVSPAEASDSGQRSFEHFLHCDTTRLPDAPDLRDSLHPQGCRALAERFRRNGSWFTVAHPMTASEPLLGASADVMKYWPDSLIVFEPDASFDSGEETAAVDSWERTQRSVEKWADAHRRSSHFYGDLRRAGIRMLAGSDTGPWVFVQMAVPGFSLHNILWNMVRQGLTPLEALQTATLNPAEFYEATDSLGTIESGKLADVVFLDADPLADIYNTRRIRAVVANGRFFDRGDLDALLLETERLARASGRP